MAGLFYLCVRSARRTEPVKKGICNLSRSLSFLANVTNCHQSCVISHMETCHVEKPTRGVHLTVTHAPSPVLHYLPTTAISYSNFATALLLLHAFFMLYYYYYYYYLIKIIFLYLIFIFFNVFLIIIFKFYINNVNRDF